MGVLPNTGFSSLSKVMKEAFLLNNALLLFELWEVYRVVKTQLRYFDTSKMSIEHPGP